MAFQSKPHQRGGGGKPHDPQRHGTQCRKLRRSGHQSRWHHYQPTGPAFRAGATFCQWQLRAGCGPPGRLEQTGEYLHPRCQFLLRSRRWKFPHCIQRWKHNAERFDFPIVCNHTWRHVCGHLQFEDSHFHLRPAGAQAGGHRKLFVKVEKSYVFECYCELQHLAGFLRAVHCGQCRHHDHVP